MQVALRPSYQHCRITDQTPRCRHYSQTFGRRSTIGLFCITLQGNFLKVQLTPKFFLPLMKTTSFLYYFSEKIISIDKIPPILQAFKSHDRAWWDLGRASSDVIEGHCSKHSSDVRLGFECCENIFGVFVLHIFSKMDKTSI